MIGGKDMIKEDCGSGVLTTNEVVRVGFELCKKKVY